MTDSPYEYYNKQLGVKMRFLISDRNRHENSLCVDKYRTFKKRLDNPNACETQLRTACFGCDALVQFSTLPRLVKDALVARWGDGHVSVEKNHFKQAYAPDYVARDFYIKHRYGDDSKSLENQYIDLYQANASVLNTVIKMRTNRIEYAKARNLKGQFDIWQSLSNDVNAFREVTHDLPTSRDGLRRKVTDYEKNGYKALISEKFGMRNAVKVKLKEQEALLDELIAKHTNLDDEMIAYIYNACATQMNWLEITAGTVANRRKKSNMVTYARRKSGAALANNVLMQHKRTAPTAPLLFWTQDGWDAELLYQKTFINAKGHSTTTYHNRLTMVVVLDAYNKYPIGYAIGEAETPDLIRAALRNAINHTAYLFGSRHIPQQLQSDNYQIGNLRKTYEAITKYYTPARVANAKAKVVEPYFSYINKNYCRLLDNWSGFNVASGSKNQPNDDIMNKIKKDFPDEAGCRKQLTGIIEAERLKKGAQFMAQWQAMNADLKLPFATESYYLALGQTTGSTNRLVGSGLHLTINGSRNAYDSFDINFRKQAHQDWTILYDESNPSEVLAVSKCEKYRFILNQKHAGAMAIVERTEQDMEVYSRINAHNKTTTEYIVAENRANAGLVESLFENPLLSDTLAKHLLVDSRGQHKDQRSRERLEHNGAKQIIKAERADAKASERSWQEDQNEYISNKVDFSQYVNL